MMVHFRQLHYFIVTAETGHIGRAAVKLNMTQPPLSRQLALLEQEVGTPLFSRHPKGVSLTAAGSQYYEDARHILRSVDQAAERARSVAAGKQGAVSIGFMMHAAYNIVPPLTRAFMHQHPNVSMSMREMIPGNLLNEVTEGNVDAAITLKQELADSLSMLHLCSEKLCLAVPVEHELANASLVSASMLRNTGLIATPFDVAPTLRKAIENYCESAGFRADIVLETQLQQTIISLVNEGLGTALVPDPVRKLRPEGVRFLPLDNPPSVEYVLIWRTDNPNPALRAFTNVAQRVGFHQG